MYHHEATERRLNTKPMNTQWPSYDVGEDMTHDIPYLASRKLSTQVARHNSWYVSREAGDSYPRLVIPAVTHVTGHAYWQARDMTGKAYIRYQCPEGPRHAALIVVSPIGCSFGNVVVEGPMDALAAAGEHYTGFALMGTQPNKETLYHLALLLGADRTVVLLDRDAKHYGVPITCFLASNGHMTKLACLEGPEKDLAECLPVKRKAVLRKFFHSFT